MKKQYIRIPRICAVILVCFLFCACSEQSYLQRNAEMLTEADHTAEGMTAAEEAASEEVRTAGSSAVSGGADETAFGEHAPSEAETSEPQTGHTPETQTVQICVQITGAVNHPGVYFLEENARLFDLVEAAGGLTADADPDAINQARMISDGEQIIVRTREQTAQDAALGQTGDRRGLSANPDEAAEARVTGDDGRIDLNTADEAALSELPGIGGTKAAAIVAYRREHGRFSAAEEIMLVPGIKAGTYEKIKDRIAVR